MENSNPYSAPESEVAESSKVKQSYSLSTSNKIFYGLAILFSVVSFFLIGKFSSYEFGQLFGKVISYMLLPFFISWIIWRITGRSKIAGSITFNIILVLLLLGQVVKTAEQIEKNESLEAIKSEKNQFKEYLSENEDANFEEAGEAYNKFTDSVKDEFKNLSEKSQGSEKLFFKLMAEFVNETQAEVLTWRNSYSEALSDDLFNYPLLKSDQDYESRKAAIRRYISASKKYLRSFEDTIPKLKSHLEPVGKDNALVKGAIEGALEKHNKQKPIFNPLIQEHIKYGENLIAMLDLLQNNKNQWSYDNSTDQLLFDDNQISETYDELFEKVTNNETAITTLSNKIIETI